MRGRKRAEALTRAALIPPTTAAALVGFLAAFLSSPGQTFLIGLYVDSIIGALDTPRVVVTGWYAGATALAAVLLAPVGRLADAWTPERFLLVVLACVVFGMACLASASAAWQIFVAFTLLRLCGQGAVGVGILSLIARRFQQRRGWLLSRAQLGHPAGELVLPLVVASLIASIGWRGSLYALVGMSLAVVAVIIWLLRHVVAQPDRGIPFDSGAAADAGGEGLVLKEAMRRPAFWCAALSFSVPPVVFTALVFHHVALFHSVEIGARWVPAALACIAIGQVVTTWVAGRFADYVTVRSAAVISCLTTGGAVMMLVTPLPAEIKALTYGGLLGGAVALSALSGALVWPILFGTRAVGSIRSVTSALRNGATAGAPLLLTTGITDANLSGGVWILSALTGIGIAAGIMLPPIAARARPPQSAVAVSRV